MSFRLILFILFLFLNNSLSLISQEKKMDSLFHPDSIRHIVEVLASDSLEGRFTGSAGNAKAALFIASEFQKAGLKQLAGNNGFFMPMPNLGSNVVGAIAGKSKAGELVIFSAHYDHIGTNKTNPYPGGGGNARAEKGDNIFNGANDDASGVSAVISLAKYFVQKNNNERTILFIAFTGEELGLKGSQEFAELCKPDSIIAVINIEMIGRKYFKMGNPFITGYEFSQMQSILNSRLKQYNKALYGDNFIVRDPFPFELLYQRSDNYSFAKKGIPAHSIMATSPYDKYYHNKNDEASTLDYNLMKEIITAIAIGSEGFVTGEDTLKRIR